MTTYTAIASKDPERGWLIRVPGLGTRPEHGLPTWARSIRDIEPMARDLIAVYLDVPPDSFEVDRQVMLPADHYEALLEELEDLKDRLSVHERTGDTRPFDELRRELGLP